MPASPRTPVAAPPDAEVVKKALKLKNDKIRAARKAYTLAVAQAKAARDTAVSNAEFEYKQTADPAAFAAMAELFAEYTKQAAKDDDADDAAAE